MVAGMASWIIDNLLSIASVAFGCIYLFIGTYLYAVACLSGVKWPRYAIVLWLPMFIRLIVEEYIDKRKEERHKRGRERTKAEDL